MENMDSNYKYEGAHLKPKIAKAIILELFAGKTVSRREIDEGLSNIINHTEVYHQRRKQTRSKRH